MKLVLAAVLCALAINNVMSMPVAEPGIPEPLPVVPLEKSSPAAATQHVLRRETEPVIAPVAPVAAAPAITEHHEGETAEEHAAHAHLTARLDDKTEKIPEPAAKAAEEPAAKLLAEEKPLPEEKKIIEVEPKKEEKKEAEPVVKTIAIEAVEAAQAVAAEIITPAEVLAPIPAAPAQIKVSYSNQLN